MLDVAGHNDKKSNVSTIIIPGRFPGQNEIIAAAKSGKGKYQPYAGMKDQYTLLVATLARKIPAVPPYAGAVNIKVTWFESNAKRDPDNIMAAQKFILDGLVKAGVIKNDTQRYIKELTHKFEVDRYNERIVVEIREAC